MSRVRNRQRRSSPKLRLPAAQLDALFSGGSILISAGFILFLADVAHLVAGSLALVGAVVLAVLAGFSSWWTLTDADIRESDGGTPPRGLRLLLGGSNVLLAVTSVLIMIFNDRDWTLRFILTIFCLVLCVVAATHVVARRPNASSE